MRVLNTVENERKSWHKSEFIYTKEYIYLFIYLYCLPSPQE